MYKETARLSLSLSLFFFFLVRFLQEIYMTTNTSSSINYSVICNSCCNQQSFHIMYVSYPANTIISDSTMANKIVLWNDDRDKLKVGNSYRLKQVLVRSYQGDKFLQYPKQGATYEEVEDIGTVSLDDVNTYDTITNSEVAGVLSFDDFLACLVCKSKVQPADEKLGTCTSCKTLQKISLCKRQVRAKLLLTRPGGSYITLNVFGDHVKQICCQEAVSEENLLQASPFSFTYNNQIINSLHSQ